MKITSYSSSDLSDLYLLCGKLTSVQEKKKHIFILTESEDLQKKIDKEMWTFSQNFFIPHFCFEDLEAIEAKPYSQSEQEFIKTENPIVIFSANLFFEQKKKIQENINPEVYILACSESFFNFKAQDFFNTFFAQGVSDIMFFITDCVNLLEYKNTIISKVEQGAGKKLQHELTADCFRCFEKRDGKWLSR